MKNEQADLMHYVFKCLNHVHCMKYRTGTGLAYFDGQLKCKCKYLFQCYIKMNETKKKKYHRTQFHKRNAIHSSQMCAISCDKRNTNNICSFSIVFFQMQKRLKN